MKKNILIAGLLVSGIGFSANEQYQMLARDGNIAPYSGIKVLPRAQIKLSESMMKESVLADEQIKSLGYIKKNNPEAYTLLNIKKSIELSKKQISYNDSPESTHMRKNIGDINLAFHFKQIPISIVDEYIGAAPMGAYHHEGWSGAAEFFTKSGLGSCSYGLMSLKVSGMSAELASEVVSYHVNSKISVIEVIGNQKSGYVYSVKWFDNEFYHELECANKDFDVLKKDTIVNFAKDLDRL